MEYNVYRLKDFIRELTNQCVGINGTIDLSDWVESVRRDLDWNYCFSLDKCGSSEKINAILRFFSQLLYDKGDFVLNFNKFISLLRKSKQAALRTQWNSEQIDDTVKVVIAGFTHRNNTTDEETDSNSDSAFSSDDN